MTLKPSSTMNSRELQAYLTIHLDGLLQKYSDCWNICGGQKTIYAELTAWLNKSVTEKLFSHYTLNLSYRDKTFSAVIEYYPNAFDGAPHVAGFKHKDNTYPTVHESATNHVSNHYTAFDYAMKGI